MKEPANTPKKAIIQNIINAAYQEFADKGYDGASLSNIAREAGTTKQLLHYYFAGKDQLYTMAVSDISDQVVCLFDATAYQDLEPVAAIRLLINKIVDLHIAFPALSTITLDQGLHHAELLSPQLDIGPQTIDFVNQVLTPLLKHGEQAGVFRTGVDPALFYASTFHLASGCFLLGSSMSYTCLSVDFTESQGVEHWREHVLDMVVASLRA